VHERLEGYFGKTVFSQPAAFTFGNLTPTPPDIRNDGIRTFDLSLFKDFAPLERLRMQFRAEALKPSKRSLSSRPPVRVKMVDNPIDYGVIG